MEPCVTEPRIKSIQTIVLFLHGEKHRSNLKTLLWPDDYREREADICSTCDSIAECRKTLVRWDGSSTESSIDFVTDMNRTDLTLKSKYLYSWFLQKFVERLGLDRPFVSSIYRIAKGFQSDVNSSEWFQINLNDWLINTIDFVKESDLEDHFSSTVSIE